ncbi:velvet factor-domain-containing protein [Pilaira anomala]|nr:velvet factor-domain-containing protein [Pilaira anomala]
MNTYIPPPLKLSRPSQFDVKYTIKVIQNPIRARCCGFGQKDRRPIDPPPILELLAEDHYGKKVDLKPEDSILFLAQCELYNVDSTENRTLVNTPWSSTISTPFLNSNDKQKSEKPEYVRNLIGSTVSNAYHLVNPEDRTGAYFIFHDLSVRTEGTFTLKFIFVNLAAGEPLTMTTQIEQEVFSSPFSVYPAKKFPGLTESTLLSRCFSKQGIKIPIRNESTYKRITQTHTPYNQEEEDDDNDQNDKQEQVQPIPRMNYTRLPISDFLSPE